MAVGEWTRDGSVETRGAMRVKLKWDEGMHGVWG